MTDNRIQITAGQPETAVFFAARKEVITMPDIGKQQMREQIHEMILPLLLLVKLIELTLS